MLLIHLYRWSVGLMLIGRCRFTPSCSAYALEALEKKGVLAGCWLVIKRLGRCHPWHPGGSDTVE